MSYQYRHDSDWQAFEFLGTDARDFLNRLSTNTLPTQESPLSHHFFLTVNAKIESEFWVSKQANGYLLLCPSVQATALREIIDRYHFGEKIELKELEADLFVVLGGDPGPDIKSLPDPRYGEGVRWCLVPNSQREAFAQQGEETLKDSDLEWRRVAQGRPRFGVDYDPKTLFVEVAQNGDFSETKGCYPGQEIVARVLHRGALRRHLRAFQADGKIPEDWTFQSDGKEMARVKTTILSPDGQGIGFLLVRQEFGEEGTVLEGQDGQGAAFALTVVPRYDEVLTGAEE